MSRGPVAFHKHQVVRRALPKRLSIVLHSPLKIPVPSWNIEVLRPFSDYAPSALSDFSSRLPPSTPSDATAEGNHTRCFRRLLAWRDVREDRPYTARVLGEFLLEYHARRIQALEASEPPLWRSHAPSHLRVLIEKRNTYGKTGTRQFLQLESLLAACNNGTWVHAHAQQQRHAAEHRDSGSSGAGNETHFYDEGGSEGGGEDGTGGGVGGGGAQRGHGGGGGRFTTVECRAHAFGKHSSGIIHDM